MRIMPKIFMTDTLLPQQLTYSMVQSLTVVSRKQLRHQESVTILKQEQCTQVHIKSGL